MGDNTREIEVELPPLTARDRHQLLKAHEVMIKEEQVKPFKQALATMTLHEEAEKGRTLQKELDAVEKDYTELLVINRHLITENATLLSKIEMYNLATFWNRLLWLLGVK